MNLDKPNKKNKYLKTTLKVITYCLLGLLLLVYLFIALINTSFFQSILANKLSDYFSKEWGTELRIAAVNINIFDRIELHDVYLEDKKGDTLIYSENIYIRLNGFPTSNGINISSIKIQNSDFRLAVQEGELNFGFILDYFLKDKPKEKKKEKPFIIKISHSKIDNISFTLRLKDNLNKYPEGLVAINNIRFREINADIKNIIIINDSIRVKVLDFAAKEFSGMEIKSAKGDFIVSSRILSAKDASVESSNSNIKFDAKLLISSWKTYVSFIDSVYLEGEIKKGSRIGMKDATYWVESIKGFHQEAIIDGRFNGTISNLNFQKMDIYTASHTNVKASGSIIGLPNPKNTVYNLDIENFNTSYSDYKRMELGELLEDLPIPELLDKLGKINFKGKFNGLLSNFNTKGELKTEIGNIEISGQSMPINDLIGYKAKLLSSDFNISELFDLPWLTTKEINIDAYVVGNNLDNLKGELKGGFGGLSLMNNYYDTIFLNAQIEDREVNANFLINDNSIKMDGITSIYLDDDIRLHLESNIYYANPRAMNLFNFHDTTTSFSTHLIADLKSINPKTLAGNLKLENLRIDLSEEYYIIDNFDAELSHNNSINSLIINSDILDLSLIGKYDFISLGNDISKIVQKYVPNLNKEEFIKDRKSVLLVENIFNNNISEFELSTIIKNPKPIFALFSPSIALSENTHIYSSLNQKDKLKINLGAKQIYIGGLYFRDIKLESKILDDDLFTSIISNQFNITDSISLNNLNLNLYTRNNKLDLIMNFDDRKKEASTKGFISFKSIIINNILQGSFENSFIELAGNKTYINNDHILSYSKDRIAILNLELLIGKEKININGMISDNLNDKLQLSFYNVDISHFNILLKDIGLEIGGRLNETIILKNIMDKPSITCDLIVDSLEINNNFLGRASIDISNTISLNEFFVDISILYKGNKGDQNMPLSIKGYVYPKSLVNNFNLKLSLKDFNLGIVKNYISNFSSDFKGYLSGENIIIKGNFKQPDIRGVLFCRNGEINIDLINTKYYFSDSLVLNNNIFSLKNFKLYDINKNSLTLNGQIKHINFQDFKIDLTANANNIRVLNTNPSSDQMYFGSAYTTATASLKGDLEYLKIDVNAKTEKGTKLTIPISSKTSVNQRSFIEFVEKTNIDDKNKYISITNKDISKKSMRYDIDIKLNVGPEAEISLPLNFTNLRGELTASGKGELKLEINDKGTFNMYGGIEISNGVFNMVLMNLVEKNFIIQKGGRIDWNGNPAMGIIEAEAIYKTKASLAPILRIDKYSKPVDVHSVILLSGSMMNPQPKFDIRLPNTDQQTIDQLFMTIDRNDEKQMLEQTVSLLVMRQFYVSTGGVSDNFRDADLTSSAFEVAFGQISGMLSNMIKFVDVGLNYTPGSEAFSDQLDVNLSKSIGRWELVGDFVFGGKDMAQAEDAKSFLGDISAEYKITENFRLKAFNRSNANDFTKYNITPYTQGVGITYKKQYDSFDEILESIKDVFKQKRKENILK